MIVEEKYEMFLMKARNRIKTLIDGLGITRYEFWQNTRLSQNTAYRLYDDPSYIPGSSVIEKIFNAYGWQPGDYLIVDGDSSENQSVSTNFRNPIAA